MVYEYWCMRILQVWRKAMKAINLMIVNTLTLLLGKVNEMSIQMEDLTREVEEQTTVVDSAITLLSTLAEEIRANAADQVALGELANRLDASGAALADAVAANTKAADEPPVA